MFVVSDNLLAVADSDGRDVDDDLSPRFQPEDVTNKNDESISLT